MEQIQLPTKNELRELLPYLTRRERRELDLLLEGTVNQDPVTWIMDNFYIPETNRPIDLYPSQIEPLREALRLDPAGRFVYSTVVWSAIKKSAKSSIASAVGLWFAFRRPRASIKVIANDLKQAESRVFFYMRRAIQLHPEWRNTCRVVGYKIYLPNHSMIEAIPIDPQGEAGGNDDLVIYSELWGWKNAAAVKMWTETTLSPMKFAQSMRWCETYAGYSGESPVLEGLYERGVKDGEVISQAAEMYRNGRLFVLWNTRPTLPWQTKEYYAQESSDLLESEFNRVHRNQWGSSTSTFVPSEWWDACLHELPPYEKLEPWVIALDAAVSGDCFGMVAVTRKNGIVIPRFIRKWTPPAGGQIMFFAPPGTPPDKDESPAGELRRLTSRHSVVKVCYDPYQLHSFCKQMAGELIVFFDEFSQAGKRLQADKGLRDLIRERRIWHDGNKDLREHITNANVQQGETKDQLRIVKRTEHAKIDLAVCTSMAAYEAEQMNLG